MTKINTEIVIFIVFLTLVALWELFIKVQVEAVKTPYPESKVGVMAIQL